MNMFCYQCEQTSHGTGCTTFGICGKDPDTAALQDVVVYAAKGLAMYNHRLRSLGSASVKEFDHLILEALFATVTNVDFDPKRLAELLNRQSHAIKQARVFYEIACEKSGVKTEHLDGPAKWEGASTLSGLIEQGGSLLLKQRLLKENEDVVGLQELILYGLKGMASYAHHAVALGFENEDVFAFISEALSYLTVENTSLGELLTKALKVGEINLKVLELLDKAHVDTYGKQEPTSVRIYPRKGKAILVSGHDLKDLEELLKQTEGKGIDVYTHGEMLPAHAYPGLKKYPHLAGNFGGAWMEQRIEFPKFPGPILMTTNCIQKPKESYKARIFTSGVVAWPGVDHIENHDYSPLITAALASEGFIEDAGDDSITIGFGHHAVLGVADKIVAAVKEGHLKHMFLIGGCDGAEGVRNYFTDFAEAVPDDCVILTLGCGKYRFNKLEFGDIGGIPRLLDMGQCNDAYSAIKVAVALADVFQTDVNGLPLSMIISWFEQKAVCVLLTLLHLGVKNIRLGPALPGFITPNVLNILVQEFNLMPIKTAEADLQAILK